jgi:HK97 family phage portal protein
MHTRKLGYFRTLVAAAVGRLAVKASAVGPLIARMMLGQPVWPGRDFEKLAREGYQQNPVVCACIALIAKAVADIPWCMYEGRGAKAKEIEEHEFFDLMQRPNPGQDRAAFLRAFISYYLLTGNAYAERTEEKNLGRMELYAHRPDRMKIIPGEDGTPQAYEYMVNGIKRRFEVDDARKQPILHLKTFNPTNDWYGQSPLDACAWAIDLHNGGSAHNKAILDNSGAPAGALIFEGSEAGGNTLSPEAYETTLARLNGKEQGYERSGNKMLLEGGKHAWLQFGLDPEKMQFIEGMNRAAREIAFTLGVPPMLLGIPGDNTYSNYQEARQAFYQETVIPLAWEIVRALNHWFAPALGKAVYLEPNLDDIDALAEVREKQWNRIEKSTILSLNEKREALGYEPVEGGDAHYESAGNVPIGTAATVEGEAAPEDGDDDAYWKSRGKSAGARHMPTGAVHSPDRGPP